jgi:FkbM family methyltransferase
MKVNILKKIARKFSRDVDFLESVSGVIHVGANVGQEREIYKSLGLRVLWIEPIPEVFKKLEKNIADIDNQQAVQALLTNKDNETYSFHVANNNGASSSIFEFKEHKNIWPHVEFNESIQLQSITLPTLFEEQNLDISAFDALIMDTQGSELLVLQGALPVINNFSFIKSEVADFESYSGCCKFRELEQFMRAQRFRQYSCEVQAHKEDVGSYYDVVYKKGVCSRLVPW